MIELVTTEADAMAAAKAKADSIRANEEWTLRKLAIIKQALMELDDELGHFEQTCHGSMYFHAARIEDVADAMVRMWNDPSSFNTSELSQRIGGFLKVTT